MADLGTEGEPTKETESNPTPFQSIRNPAGYRSEDPERSTVRPCCMLPTSSRVCNISRVHTVLPRHQKNALELNEPDEDGRPVSSADGQRKKGRPEKENCSNAGCLSCARGWNRACIEISKSLRSASPPPSSARSRRPSSVPAPETNRRSGRSPFPAPSPAFRASPLSPPPLGQSQKQKQISEIRRAAVMKRYSGSQAKSSSPPLPSTTPPISALRPRPLFGTPATNSTSLNQQHQPCTSGSNNPSFDDSLPKPRSAFDSSSSSSSALFLPTRSTASTLPTPRRLFTGS